MLSNNNPIHQYILNKPPAPMPMTQTLTTNARRHLYLETDGPYKTVNMGDISVLIQYCCRHVKMKLCYKFAPMEYL